MCGILNLPLETVHTEIVNGIGAGSGGETDAAGALLLG
jgi:hypothetical protein